MTRLLAALALLSASVRSAAQDRHFLYLQTDNEQAFYLRVGGETRSSTAAGYLILPRLKDGPLDFTVGFPLRRFPEYRFRIEGLREDRGLALKDFGEKGWGLFDMQSLQVTYGERLDRDAPLPVTARPPAPRDAFATVLASAMGDSSLMDASLVASGEKSPQPPRPPARSGDSTSVRIVQPSDTVVAVGPPGRPAASPLDSPALVRVRLPEPAAVGGDTSATRRGGVRPTGPDRIRKLLDLSDTSGVQVVYADTDEHGRQDTVAVWIPADTAARPPVAPSPQPGRPPRTDCKGMVSTTEVGQLGRRMEAIPDEDARVAAALREFRLRCFTTDQVRTLLSAFAREEGRYKLLDAAFPRIYDPEAFLELQSVLKDPYFIHRFRKLVGVQ